jgi:hypothetical protein
MDTPKYRPLTGRRRLLILLLAVATAITVVLTLLYPPGGVKRKRPPVPEPPRCSEGQSTDCLGGTAQVIVAPPASAASR